MSVTTSNDINQKRAPREKSSPSERLPDHDILLLDQHDDEQVRRVREKIRAFNAEHVEPIINDYWERAEFPFELIKPLSELNLAGGTISGNGCPGLSVRAAAAVSVELARCDGSINTFFGVHSGLAMGSINMLGNNEQRARFLPAMAKLEKIGAFALTEPDHGSDSVALETSARREGDQWILNGAKRWIGNASYANIVVIYARDEADAQVKAFVLEREPGTEFPDGFNPTVITGKIGKRAILQPDIVIKDLAIAEANRLEHCNSFKDVNKVLNATRAGVAFESLGHAISVYEDAVKYTAARVQFGKPVASFQLVQNKLANLLADVSAIKLYVDRLVELQESGQMTGTMASLAKMYCARTALHVASTARDLLGGNGLLLENHVARHLTDMEVVYTYEGTDHMQSLIVGRAITGLSAFA